MKKIIIFLICLVGVCGCNNYSAADAAKEYLNKFKNHNEEVMISLNELIKNENLTKEQEDIYTLIMKKQYDDLEFKIKEEIYNGNKATVSIEITVYDYFYSKHNALKYKEANETEFLLSDNSFNTVKYQNLQLKYMEKCSKRIKYRVDFDTIYENKSWNLISPNYKILQKIHGIYDYLNE